MKRKYLFDERFLTGFFSQIFKICILHRRRKVHRSMSSKFVPTEGVGWNSYNIKSFLFVFLLFISFIHIWIAHAFNLCTLIADLVSSSYIDSSSHNLICDTLATVGESYWSPRPCFFLHRCVVRPSNALLRHPLLNPPSSLSSLIRILIWNHQFQDIFQILATCHSEIEEGKANCCFSLFSSSTRYIPLTVPFDYKLVFSEWHIKAIGKFSTLNA